MATKNIALPELGEGVTEGELVKWLVKPGDKIQAADQAIAGNDDRQSDGRSSDLRQLVLLKN